MKEWMLPVFIVVVWIVQYILRNRENEEPVRAARGKAGDRPANRSPGSEIDRFLQEIERMKKKSAEDRPEPPKASRAPLPKVLPAVGKPPRVRPVAPRVQAQPADALSVPIIPLERLSSLTPPAAPIRSVGTLPTAPKAVARARRLLSPALEGALSLLRSPQSAASAIVLNEILSPPKCRRR
jgi:hypothetical protein